MNAPLYHRKLQRALDIQGGLFALPDILERISDGRMQSWVHNNSWAITQISIYPRRRLHRDRRRGGAISVIAGFFTRAYSSLSPTK